MHLRENFKRGLEENVFLILAIGIALHLQFFKQAMLFKCLCLCMCHVLTILILCYFASLTSHQTKLGSDVTSSVKPSLIGCSV